MSPSRFELEVKRVEVDSSKKDHEVDIGEEFAGGRRGGESGVVTVAVDKTTQYKYTLIAENKGGFPLRNIMVELFSYMCRQKFINSLV